MLKLLPSFRRFVTFTGIDIMPHYAVRIGRSPGVYDKWPDCEKQVKGFPGARYRKFNTEDEAWGFVNATSPCKPGSEEVPPAHISVPSAPVTRSPVAARGMAHSTRPSNTTGDAQGMTSSATTFAGHNVKTVLSSTRLMALKTTICNIHTTIGELASFAETAQTQIEEIEKVKKTGSQKRLATYENSPSKKPRTIPGAASVSSDSGYTEPGAGLSASVYTDGCCHNNGKHGAVAGIGVYWGPMHPRNVAERLQGRPTNNRAEIHAACMAVRQAKQMKVTDLTLHTDSNFLINGITKWIHKWKKNGWKLVDGKEVINKDDFQELDGLLHGINVKWVHVRGHQGIVGNEEADRLANEGARKNQ